MKSAPDSAFFIQRSEKKSHARFFRAVGAKNALTWR